MEIVEVLLITGSMLQVAGNLNSFVVWECAELILLIGFIEAR